MRLILALILSGLVGRAEAAEVRLQAGWGGVTRAARWNPLFVRASDGSPRNVVLELNLPSRGGFGVTLREQFAVGPQAATYELLEPSRYSSWEQTVAVLRDASTGRVLAFTSSASKGTTPSVTNLGPSGVLIGLVGDGRGQQALSGAAGGSVAYIPERLLPRSAVGYDAIDVLFLDGADLRSIDDGQQNAILDWLRAGGSLMVYPGDADVPAAGPLPAAFPCRFGPIVPLQIPAEVLEAAGIESRFSNGVGRALEPNPGAESVELFAGIRAVGGGFGLGRVVVLPLDPMAVPFTVSGRQAAAKRFWAPILRQVISPPVAAPRRTYDAPYEGYESETEDQQREGSAVDAVSDFLEPARPVRWGWFAGIAPGLIGILTLIGPIDWLVLRLLGRRPWTVLTSAGWIGLFAAVGLFAADQLRRGPASVRTATVVQQVGDRSVASVTLLALHSPHDRTYELAPQIPGGWWEPVVPASLASVAAPRPDLVFHESDSGSTPEAISVAARGAVFLRGRSVGAGPSVLKSDIAIDPATGRLRGTLTNVGEHALADLHVRTKEGVVTIPLPDGSLAAAGSVTLNVPAKGEAASNAGGTGRYQNYGAFGSRAYAHSALSQQDLWPVVPDLFGRRALRVDEMVAGGKFAAVDARVLDPAAAVTVGSDAGTSVESFEWVLAVVPLGR